jgi:hypothetical protein
MESMAWPVAGRLRLPGPATGPAVGPVRLVTMVGLVMPAIGLARLVTMVGLVMPVVGPARPIRLGGLARLIRGGGWGKRGWGPRLVVHYGS